MSDPDVFRFNDLPDELKLKVYEQYFLETAIHMCHFNDKKNNFCFNGMPSLNLELTCKAVCKESRKARARHISTTVIISEEFFLRKNMKKFAASSKYAWLRKHIRQLKIAASTASIGERRLEENWLKFVPCLPNLQGVELNLPCTLIVSPIAREDFSSISAFHDFLGGAVRRFGDPEATINEYSLATTYGLNALAVALNATEKSGKIQVDFRHWAVSRLDPDDSYFSVVRFDVLILLSTSARLLIL